MKKLFNNAFVMIAVCIIYVFSMAFIMDSIDKEAWWAAPTLFFMLFGAGMLFLRTVWLLVHHMDE
jgi:hypothetical protein